MLEVILMSVPYRCLRACQEVLCHSFPGNSSGSSWVMAAKWHYLGILSPSLLKIISSAVSNLLIHGRGFPI